MDYETSQILREIQLARDEILARKQALVDAINCSKSLIEVLDNLSNNLRDFAQHIIHPSPSRIGAESQLKTAFNSGASHESPEMMPHGRSVQSSPRLPHEEEGIVITYNDEPRVLHSKYQARPFGVVNGNE